MTLWIIIGILALIVALMVSRPLLRSDGRVPAPATGHDLAIYRDQLGELERDLEYGVVDPAEASAARAEIERRILKADHAQGDGAISARAPRIAAVLGIGVVAASLAIYWQLGAPALPGQPLAERQEAARQERALSGDIASRTDLLRQRTEREPDNLEAWVLLAKSYFHLRRYTDSAQAYRRALALSDERPNLLSAYAEAVTQANGNRVVQAARLAFEQAAAARPEDPRARYYLGLHAAQAKQFDVALDRWRALLADSPAEAPWRPMVVRGIRDMARFQEIDPATVLAAADLKLVEGEVSTSEPTDLAALRTKLGKDPKNYQGWLTLARGEAARGDLDAAREAIARVSALYPDAPFVQQQIRQAAIELGVDAEASAGRGPTTADVQAAAEMTPDERDQMIEGMVAGLAARLEDSPDDLEGWLMLMRSYATLGRTDAAAEALRQATGHFANNAQARAAIDQTAGQLGMSP